MMALAVSTMTAGPATAAAIYTYHQTASTPGGLPVSIEMMFDHPAAPVAGNSFAGGFNGLLSFVYRIGAVTVDLDDLVAMQARCAGGDPGCTPQQLLYDLSPEEGEFRFNNTQYDFAFSYEDGRLRGAFNTDFPGPAECRTTGTCTYEGTWTPIPEPLTAGLLAGGLIGLFWIGQRLERRSAAAS